MVSGFIPVTACITASAFPLVSPPVQKGKRCLLLSLGKALELVHTGTVMCTQHRGHSLTHLNMPQYSLLGLWYEKSGSNPVLILVHFA